MICDLAVNKMVEEMTTGHHMNNACSLREEINLQCQILADRSRIFFMKMKSVVFELVSLFSLAEMTSAWLQKLPYKLENGFLAYGSFSPFYYHSLTTTKIITSSPEDKLDCGFACIAEPKCVSFNIAANPDSNHLFLCELLDTDMFHEKGKLQSNASFHHFSPVSQHSLKPMDF